MAAALAAMSGPKECKQCRQLLDRSHFHNDNRRVDGLFPYCKPCRRLRSGAKPMRRTQWSSKSDYDRKRRTALKNAPGHRKAYRAKYLWSTYRITVDEYNQLLVEQGGGCAICHKKPSELSRELAVDHDHACCSGSRSCGGCIRGLLCNSCNTVLGHLRDDIDLMQKAINYLASYRGKPPALSLFDIA